jgi:hypothetical protein
MVTVPTIITLLNLIMWKFRIKIDLIISIFCYFLKIGYLVKLILFKQDYNFKFNMN